MDLHHRRLIKPNRLRRHSRRHRAGRCSPAQTLGRREKTVGGASGGRSPHRVANIPRLELVAEIIRHQAKEPAPNVPLEVLRGSHLLRAALELERHAARGWRLERPWEILRAASPALPDYIIKSLSDFRTNVTGVRSARIRELMPGWVVDEDIRTTNGLMVLTKGHELTDTAISALQRLLSAEAIKEPIRVRGLPDSSTPVNVMPRSADKGAVLLAAENVPLRGNHLPRHNATFTHFAWNRHRKRNFHRKTTH